MGEKVSDQNEFILVGIGASAGGLAPLKSLFSSFDEASGMAFVVVQHLDPTHESRLSEILTKHSKLSVVEAQDNQEICDGCVYVIPPNAYITAKDNRLHLTEPSEKRGERRAIDYLFRSIAKNYGKRGVGIVLSGAGNDGTAGMRSIRAAGGFTLAQEPEDAQHRSMPLSAIGTDVVDKILSVQDIPETLRSYCEHSYVWDRKQVSAEDDDSSSDEDDEDNLEDFASLLEAREDFNLKQYKPNTVQRRIKRRMSLTNVEDRNEYLELLRNNDSERRELTKDLLINVTDFFRDPEAFEALYKTTLVPIAHSAEEGEVIRIWVPGCATGEEAYTLTILMLEALKSEGRRNELKVFATDIDDLAIARGRKAQYPLSIASEVPKKYLSEYFTQHEDQYFQINQNVRDMVSFAQQNVADDPPFSRMHLVSCRNLLIYLKKEVQERVLASFYYALLPNCYLFFGTSETVGGKTDIFKTLSNKWRVYQKRGEVDAKQVALKHLHIKRAPNKSLTPERQKRKETASRGEQARRYILESCQPPTVVINESYQTLYHHGDLSPFMEVSSGEPKHDLLKMIIPELRSRMRSAIYRARKDHQPVIFRSPVSIYNRKGESFQFQVKVQPGNSHFEISDHATIITFERTPEVPIEQQSDIKLVNDEHIKQGLEQELAEAKEELQNTIEELETSTEELKAAHEEALSTNEELQSSNEELEASSEELRSLNEELSTVNAEYKDKIEELHRANNDVQNFFSSTDIATLFLDDRLTIKRYTPAAEMLLKMGPTDIDRPIASLGRELVQDNLQEEAQSVLQNFIPQEKEIVTEQGRHYVRRVSPYRTEGRKVEGVVIVFQEVTEMKSLSKRALYREKQQAAVARLGLSALDALEPLELMQQAVRQVSYVLDVDFCKIMHYRPVHNDLLLVAGVGWQEGSIGKKTVPADIGSQAGYTLNSVEPVIVNDISVEKRFAPPNLLTDHKINSGLSCRIENGAHPYGVLSVHTRTKREFSNDDANFLVAVANMISYLIRRVQWQEELQKSEQMLDTALKAADMGVHAYNVATGMVDCDDKLREIWGLAHDEPFSIERFRQSLHPDDIERVDRTIAKALDPEGSGRYYAQYRINRNDGTQAWVEATGSVSFHEGKAVRMVGTVQDITKRKLDNDRLEDAVSKLEKADQQKDEFLAVLGHELRNPLAAISSSIFMLEDAPELLDKVLEPMKHSTVSMERLLNDLLDLSRISQRRLHLELKPLDLAPILSSAVSAVHKTAQDKEQEITISVEEPLPVNGDAVRLEQIFTNLLTNACRYTEGCGEIELSAKIQDREILFLLRDNGIGISEDMLESIFEPFVQAKSPSPTSVGLGIGLALCKQLVHKHNGSIKARSKGLDHGSEFEVRLPLLPEGKEILQLQKQSDEHVELPSGQSILVVDDNEYLLETLSIRLKSKGMAVIQARTGKEALQCFSSSTSIDHALIDLGLPDMSGHDLATQLAELGYRGGLFAHSGYSHESARKKSKAAGFQAHLSKPLNLLELQKAINNR